MRSRMLILYGFKFLLSLFFAYQLNIVDYFGYLQESEDDANLWENVDSKKHFDYIIVGGGTAGCVLANRLSANPKTTVLLLEEGGDPNPLTTIPILSTTNLILNSPRLFSQLLTTKQKYSCLAYNGRCSMFTAKHFGGTTNINGLIHTRGSPQIFDEWAEITRNKIWGYESVLKFFKKSEDYHGYYQPISRFDLSLYDGNTDSQDTSPALQYFFTAAKKAGHQLIDIDNGDQARTGGYGHCSILKTIHLQMHNGFRATGVTYVRNGKVKKVYAQKEVILSAGTFGSTKLLLRSGIGPKAHLESLNIPVKVELPVGTTFIDHYFSVLVFSINKKLFFYPERDTTPNDLIKYVTSKTGYLAKSRSEVAYIFMKSSMAIKSKHACPDLEVTYTAITGIHLPSTTDGRDYFAVAIFLINPKSTGDLKLTRKNKNDNLLVNPNYLSHPDDVDVLAEGIQYALKLIKSSSELAAYDLRRVYNSSICGDFEINTNEYWKCYVRAVGGSGHHPTASCRMGFGKNDSKAVVDSELKVLGVAGLRVVDASIMPTILNAHICAATIMIAEIGSRYILIDSAQENKTK